MSSRVWMVTGSSSGFGRGIVEIALKNGEKVIATLRRTSDLDDLKIKYSASQLLISQLDVTKPDDIARAFHQAKEAFGKVDVVVNNAGFMTAGEVEDTPDDVARNMFEVNFWGAANVSREAVRFFREENVPGTDGWLLNISSIVGVQPVPVIGYYSASKAAIDSLTQALADELDPKWDIKVILVLPGFFRTELGNKGVILPVHPAYTNSTSKIRCFVDVAFDPSRSIKVGDPQKAVQQIFRVTKLTKPPQQLFLGLSTHGDARAKIELLGKNVEEYASWSEDLLED